MAKMTIEELLEKPIVEFLELTKQQCPADIGMKNTEYFNKCDIDCLRCWANAIKKYEMDNKKRRRGQ